MSGAGISDRGCLAQAPLNGKRTAGGALKEAFPKGSALHAQCPALHRSGLAHLLHGNGMRGAVLASTPAALHWMPPKLRDPGKTKARTK